MNKILSKQEQITKLFIILIITIGVISCCFGLLSIIESLRGTLVIFVGLCILLILVITFLFIIYLIMAHLYWTREAKKQLLKKYDFNKYLDDINLKIEEIENTFLYVAEDGIHFKDKAYVIPTGEFKLELISNHQLYCWIEIKLDYDKYSELCEDVSLDIEFDNRIYAILRRFKIEVISLDKTITKLRSDLKIKE